MKTVIITGASKGIGKASAETFRRAGDRVINISRTASSLTGVENCLIDLSEEKAEAAVLQFAEKEIEPGVIILVHNAARLSSDSVREIDLDRFRSDLAINVIAPQLLNKALLPKMTTGSAIIYIGSTLATKAVPGTYSYVVTKHALIGMMRATCQDLVGTGIHTACICPGFTDTEMLRSGVADDQAVLDSLKKASIFGRLIKPQEIADTIYFAANNPVINGAVIHANLGQVEH